MGLITDKFQQARRHRQRHHRPDWPRLGVAPDASRDDVQRAYLQKIEEFARRLAALGPEMRKLARRLQRSIWR
jgi:hypothetical protein